MRPRFVPRRARKVGGPLALKSAQTLQFMKQTGQSGAGDCKQQAIASRGRQGTGIGNVTGRFCQSGRLAAADTSYVSSPEQSEPRSPPKGFKTQRALARARSRAKLLFPGGTQQSGD